MGSGLFHSPVLCPLSRDETHTLVDPSPTPKGERVTPENPFSEGESLKSKRERFYPSNPKVWSDTESRWSFESGMEYRVLETSDILDPRVH